MVFISKICFSSQKVVQTVRTRSEVFLKAVDKGDFPQAEWSEISGKCFSNTPLGPGDGFRSCDVLRWLFFVDCHCLTFFCKSVCK